MNETSEVFEELKQSYKYFGSLSPIILDKCGNILDGKIRFSIDENWPKIKLNHIETKKDQIIARLITNVCRRKVPRKEKIKLLDKLGEIYLRDGIEPGKIAHCLVHDTGMSFRWVMKYLPDKYKKRPGIGGPTTKTEFEIDDSKYLKHIVDVSELLYKNSSNEILSIKEYVNTNFVGITLEKNVFSKFNKIAERMGISAQVIISNALLYGLKRLQSLTNDHINLSQSKDIRKKEVILLEHE